MNESSPCGLKELLEQGYVFPALLPDKNDYLLSDYGKSQRKEIIEGKILIPERLEQRLKFLDFSKLDSLEGYVAPLIDHDYGAITAVMWNSLYENLGLPIRNIMLVANPSHAKLILNSFRSDEKYLGGGLGVGFKEKSLPYLDGIVPSDLASSNICVREGNQLIGYNTDAKGFVRSLEDSFSKIGKKIEGSTIIVFGAGGTAKEVTRLIAEKKAKRITILNRSYEKAVELANVLNQKYGQIAIGGGEDIIRGYLLNSFSVPDAAINLTDKGSDGPLKEFSAFADTSDRGSNQYISRSIARELNHLNPQIIVADIVLPRGIRPITLRIAENEGLKNILDGFPMVINQAAPAYIYVQNAHPELHTKKVSEDEALDVFRKATKKE